MNQTRIDEISAGVFAAAVLVLVVGSFLIAKYIDMKYEYNEAMDKLEQMEEQCDYRLINIQ